MFSGSLVAIVTPLRPDGGIDYDAWAKLIDFHAAHGTSGIVVGGTTGESATLRDAELRELLVRACEQLRGRLAVIAESHTGRYLEPNGSDTIDLRRSLEAREVVWAKLNDPEVLKALDLLPQYEDISALSLELGFSSHSHFSAAFQQTYGRSPSEFRQFLLHRNPE